MALLSATVSCMNAVNKFHSGQKTRVSCIGSKVTAKTYITFLYCTRLTDLCVYPVKASRNFAPFVHREWHLATCIIRTPAAAATTTTTATSAVTNPGGGGFASQSVSDLPGQRKDLQADEQNRLKLLGQLEAAIYFIKAVVSSAETPFSAIVPCLCRAKLANWTFLWKLWTVTLCTLLLHILVKKTNAHLSFVHLKLFSKHLWEKFIV